MGRNEVIWKSFIEGMHHKVTLKKLLDLKPFMLKSFSRRTNFTDHVFFIFLFIILSLGSRGVTPDIFLLSNVNNFSCISSIYKSMLPFNCEDHGRRFWTKNSLPFREGIFLHQVTGHSCCIFHKQFPRGEHQNCIYPLFWSTGLVVHTLGPNSLYNHQIDTGIQLLK